MRSIRYGLLAVAGCGVLLLAKQRHTAHYHPDEATIRYRFHPRCGAVIIAVGCTRHGDEVALIIREADGAVAQLPIWMTEDRAAEMTITETPRLSLACLRDLRSELDSWQGLARDASRREGDKHATSAADPSPPRPLRVPEAAGADRRGRASEASGPGQRAPGRDAGGRRRDGAE